MDRLIFGVCILWSALVVVFLSRFLFINQPSSWFSCHYLVEANGGLTGELIWTIILAAVCLWSIPVAMLSQFTSRLRGSPFLVTGIMSFLTLLMFVLFLLINPLLFAMEKNT